MLRLFSAALFWGVFTTPRALGENSERVFDEQRRRMVATQIQARGVNDERVLRALLKVKRHLFVSREMAPYAYTDSALPIEHGQTISQPYIVALMTELAGVQPHHRVLEVGTGSGYQAAILAELALKVYSIELLPELASSAAERLRKLGYGNIEVRCGDGYQGWPEAAPFDAIVVTAAAKKIPQELVKQLKPGGRLIIPLGDFFQDLYLVTKKADGTVQEEAILPVRFVPLVENK